MQRLSIVAHSHYPTRQPPYLRLQSLQTRSMSPTHNGTPMNAIVATPHGSSSLSDTHIGTVRTHASPRSDTQNRAVRIHSGPRSDTHIRALRNYTSRNQTPISTHRTPPLKTRHPQTVPHPARPMPQDRHHMAVISENESTTASEGYTCAPQSKSRSLPCKHVQIRARRSQ